MKKVIFAAIFLITLSVVYYFAIFLPPQKTAQIKQEKQSFLFGKKTECMKICQTIYEAEAKANSGVFNPHYAYNEEKNACYYSGGSLSVVGKSTMVARYVTNCQTNEEVDSLTMIGNEVLSNTGGASSLFEYQEKEKIFMGN